MPTTQAKTSVEEVTTLRQLDQSRAYSVMRASILWWGPLRARPALQAQPVQTLLQ